MIEKKLPEGWEWKALGKVADITMGQSPPGSSYNQIRDGCAFLQGNADFGDESPTPSCWTTEPRKRAKIGSVLFSVRAPIGAVNIANTDYCIGRGLSSISLHQGENKYLYYLLRHLKSSLEQKGTGSTFKAISKSTLEELVIPLPPLETQRKIVAILEKAEATQRLRAEADALMQKFLQSVFLELFGDLMTNQMGWDILSIEQCLAKIIDYRGKTPHKEEKGIPLITAKLIKNGKISPPEEFISPSSYDEWMSRGLPQKGDVIFTTEGPLGEVAQIQTDDKIALAQRVLTLRGKSEMIDNTFLAHELRSEFIKRQLNRLSTGSTVKGIRQSEFRKIRLFVPPLKIQKRFVEIVKTIEKCQLLQQNQRSDVNYLYDSLMNKAFTGELIA